MQSNAMQRNAIATQCNALAMQYNAIAMQCDCTLHKRNQYVEAPQMESIRGGPLHIRNQYVEAEEKEEEGGEGGASRSMQEQGQESAGRKENDEELRRETLRKHMYYSYV